MAAESLGSTLRRLRERADLSQEELAAKAQVSRGSIQNWEADRRVPRRAESRRLAAALGVDGVDLKAQPAVSAPIDQQEIQEALEAAMSLGDMEEIRAALLELLARIPPASERGVG